MWHGVEVEVLTSTPTFPSVPRDEEECRTFKSVASSPCNWLLLVLATRAQGAPFTKKLMVR